MNTVAELKKHLTLTPLSDLEFVGSTISIGNTIVFGGQVLAQALGAAYQTVAKERHLHSMHAYFLEAGDITKPINYKVTIIRDGGSFSARTVSAFQEQRNIFILSASFHISEGGFEHQLDMPNNLPQPETLLSWVEISEKYEVVLPKYTKQFLQIERPVDFKPVEIVNPLKQEDLAPIANVWFKLKGEIKDLSLAHKQQILTYISDYNVLTPATNRHASKAHWGNTKMASLDHAMWFFRDFEFNDWMLYSLESPSTSRGRAFVRGNIFTRDGKLVASVTQEGLMRPIIK